ncbi:MAG: flagellar export chaperone FliS [Acidobacteria bacterium]|nr:flagellar export chaperone FliS [Acidobacteriota bacterium]
MSGNASPAYRYKEVAVNTANPLQLVVMLYDAAIASLQKARNCMKRKDIEGRSKALNRCISIISELQTCLNLREGGDIAQSLDRLYDYMKRGIIKANVDQSAQPLEEIEGLLDNICSAWRELVQRSPNTPEAGGAPRIPADTPPGSARQAETQIQTLNISI